MRVEVPAVTGFLPGSQPDTQFARISTQVLEALGGSKVNFRVGSCPSILVEAADEAPFVEDGWVGCVLRIGGMCMRVDKRDGRCVVIAIDPVTTACNPAILRTLARDRQGCLGVYGLLDQLFLS